jgi:hypothetical protein
MKMIKPKWPNFKPKQRFREKIFTTADGRTRIAGNKANQSGNRKGGLQWKHV